MNDVSAGTRAIAIIVGVAHVLIGVSIALLILAFGAGLVLAAL